MNVCVGSHTPPEGGEHIVVQLQALLTAINENILSPFEAHLKYEALHPFTDGNGRSGRAIWYWMMKNTLRVDLGFLHAFYYQTLNACG
jgi:Fic family protein